MTSNIDPKTIDLRHAREVAIDASGRASDLLRRRFGTPMEVSSKGHADFVTELDEQCEEIIREVLNDFDDSIAFMGEETSKFETEGNKVQIHVPSTCWIVDPLDGTSNYSHSFNAFAVSIGLLVDDELAVGVVQAPITGELLHATKNQGAFREHLTGAEPAKLSTVDGGNHFNIFSTSVPFRQPEYIAEHMELISKAFNYFEDIRRVGSAALDLSWVAGGSWAAFVELFLKPWDIAAGGLLVTEAGGVITDFTGNEKDWLTNGQVAASANARVHEIVLSLIE